jgi:hypothetical protein
LHLQIVEQAFSRGLLNIRVSRGNPQLSRESPEARSSRFLFSCILCESYLNA